AEGRGNALPETVLAMVQTRLEALDPEARRLLRAASIFGETFWRGGLVELLATDAAIVDAQLARLVEREVITASGAGKFAREEEYAFRHALLREAAYASLTQGDREAAHRRAAEWLERAGEQEALLVAEHLERGDQAARALAWYRRAV